MDSLSLALLPATRPRPLSPLALADCRTLIHAAGETRVPQPVIPRGGAWVSPLGNAMALGIEPIGTLLYVDKPLRISRAS